MRKFLLTIGFLGIAIIVLALVVENNDTAEEEIVTEENLISEEENAAAVKIEEEEQWRELKADSIVSYARTLLGTPYVYACAIEDKGFDCSGFVNYVMDKFNVDIPRSSSTIADAGEPVPFQEADKGDIIVFTGTNKNIRQPGHVGIIITEKGEKPMKFIHSSSGSDNIGVIISEVEETNYENRFLDVRRVLDPNES